VNPNVYIVAGPNGAGKTTFAREFLPNCADCKNLINADPDRGGSVSSSAGNRGQFAPVA